MGHPALRDAVSAPFWLDRDRPEPHPPLRGAVSADLAVVGGGFSGLWTALLAKERDPGLDVVVLEGRRIGWAATGRNGGFCAASLTHGLPNGVERFPDEIATLEALGRANLDGIEATLRRYGIDCGFERTGELSVATAPWQVAGLRDGIGTARRLGRRVEFLDRDAIRAEVHAATYEAGVWDRDGTAMLDPVRLAWGLAEACAALGVRFHEGTRVTGIDRAGGGLRLRTPHGTVTAAKVALGTGAFPSPLRRVRPFIIPVYDYALMTEPLTAGQLASIGWAHRQGIGDSANQFHYYRRTDDDRILWGGYDAVYYNGGAVRLAYDQRPATSDRLATHFFETFRSWTGCGSPTRGEGWWTPAPASARSSAPGTAGAWRTRPASPASASAPPASARRSCWTCSAASRRR
ncbi:NAD(P)/FAD-dependent oxidoreductase [Dactylosporangium aurantiacum]|uniref:NAD(P)/FAD-dependent oxidoreductase n=1 Tax=Dactylosporangium aurantiacum TaxID=35754 RepID=UPI000AD49B42|nr:FAD-dependent oxidoreductase [Dactylosporangium aurantiacum]